ncbi:profilin-4 [Octopus bimaculoides]|uniref:Profilin n=1 Tax=Octopus bimaculoides TaxID=37653 RepID=A0A0L8GBG7_OCTBM|nr:profilin-4 [Octopus bimaculoides]XP_014782460.1 profilin-4 [Octopus bimaculoides]XP_014782461.1 profilin-4 [Octopus bimaculoides]XP_014782462.1 profilin-4 [Octopus bimaculoides]XP_052821522.1 profilin-4 [Octopus bimaculoides]XP_052821523.1 profilin-4 [Octopus bimaculoides]XP_052821524.1 profilin-4 [Octopus bimaculoides]XP_052821525.1 profilin-4 [Octopus bimaculoides]|eukprot:XP_014782456.1 PREDICTED: profilin-4-like [Octopus bimaculoides]
MENPLMILQEILMKTQHVQQAAIVDARSNMVKASSIGFTLDYEALANFQFAFKNPMLIRERGLEYNKMLYTVVRAEPDVVYAKLDKRGIVLVKTNTFIVVATYIEGMYPSVCVEAVERLADYLKFKNK